MKEYKRMLEKNKMPTEKEIINYIGDNSFLLLTKLDGKLRAMYEINKELKFPFGNNYGWGYKYADKKIHLFYLFFENEALTMMIQIGDGNKGNQLFSSLSDYAKELWKNRYPCGDNGGWIQYRIIDDNQLIEVLKIISLKRRPKE